MTEKFKAGDRVFVSGKVGDVLWTAGLVGTVIRSDPCDTLVEFSEEDAQGQGHAGEANDDRTTRWWLYNNDLTKVKDEPLILGSSEVPNTFRAGSKTSQVFSHLLQGKDLTPLQAQNVYGNYRLSSSIEAIRKAGYNVETVEKTDETGHRYSSYRLASKVRSTSAVTPRLVKAA